VICLQEVSSKWAGELTPYFEQHGYTVVTGLYGNRFNGYMGCALAWPRSKYQSERVDIVRGSDTKPWPKLPSKTATGGWPRWRALKDLCTRMVLRREPPAQRVDPWAEAARRQNILLSAQLRCKASGQSFCVSTYHMPCLFGSTEKVQVMVIHCALVANYAARFAEGLPHLLCGDFNFVPSSPPYQVATQGALPDGDVHVPPTREHDKWEANVAAPLRSAYPLALGTEPSFTNFAKTKWDAEGSAFMETLDYIFVSGEWDVRQVKPLPNKADLPDELKSYPSRTEPSDHLMLWAELELRPTPSK